MTVVSSLHNKLGGGGDGGCNKREKSAVSLETQSWIQQ